MAQIDICPRVLFDDLLERHGTWYPNRIAFICGEKRQTWIEFNRRVNKVANILVDAGLQKGDKVSVLMKNSIEAAEITFGAIKAGGVIVPLSAMVPAEGLVMMVNDSESRFFFLDSSLKEIIEPFVEKFRHIGRDNKFMLGTRESGWNEYEKLMMEASGERPIVNLQYEDDFNIIYSSGTTGVPKGIVHTHFSRIQFALGLAVDFRLDSSSTSLLTTPMYTNGTWMLMLPTVLVGGTNVIMPHFDPQDFLMLLQNERCTHTFMVPTQFIVTMALPGFDSYDLSSMKTMVSAGAPLRKDTKESILKNFKCGLMEVYGVTEGIGSSLKPEEMEGKIGSVGTPILGTDLRIIDKEGKELPWGESGEIVGYGASIMRGYYNKHAHTEEATWIDQRGRTFIRTGDIGRFDQDGFLYILERKKDMILSGGINIFSIDIEEVLSRHPDVEDVAVIGIPHEKWGETPLALVIPRQEADVEVEELKTWANSRLAKYQRVSGVEFRQEFPRNALGKVLKRILRKPYLQNMEK